MDNFNERKGFLLVIDGIDGCGKSTQVGATFEKLKSLGHTCIASREPTAGPWGRKLRESALSGRLDPQEELAVILNDRRDDVQNCINPGLASGGIVIVDRYYTSTLAYQTLRGLDQESILAQNRQFAPDPDLIVLLDIDCDLALQRIRRRGDKPDYFEDRETLLRVSEKFSQLKLPNLHRIDATESTHQITDKIVAMTLEKMRCRIDATA